MDNSYTTADSGLDSTGWYPGKKHGFLNNLGRVASMGIYSPDNRMASKLNIQKLETRGQNQESLRQMKELHQLALESLHDYYAKAMPEKSPEEITKMAAQHYASKFLADTSKNNADGANAEVSLETSKGLLPGAAAAATEGQDSARAAARASTARNNNVAANESGRAPREVEEGANAISAQINKSNASIAGSRADGAESNNRELGAVAAKTFNTPYETANSKSIEIEAAKQKAIHLKSDEDWQDRVQNKLRPIVSSTMEEDANRHAMDVINARLESTAMNKALSNPTTADSLTASKLNKNSMAVPYGGSVVPVVPVNPSTMIQGETRHPDVTEQDQKINPVNGQIIPVIRRKTYGPQGTNQPPSTADFNGLNGSRAPVPVDPNVLNAIMGGR
jgi:hypothetical protein